MILKTKKRSFKQYGSGFVKDTKKFLSGLFGEKTKSKSKRKSVRRSSSTNATNKPVNCKSHGISPTNCYGGKKKSLTTTVSRKNEFRRQSRLFHPDKNMGCQVEATKKAQLLTSTYCVKEEDYHELTSSMKKKRDSEARKQREAEVEGEKRKAAEAAAQIDLEFNSNNEVGANNDYNEAKINDNTKKISVLEKAVEKLVKQIETIVTKNKTLKNNPKFKDNSSFGRKLQKTHKDNIGITRNLRLQANLLKNEIQSLLDGINAIKSIQNLSDANLEDEIQGLVESSESSESSSAKPKYAGLNTSHKQTLNLRLKINKLKPGLYKGRHVYIAGAGVSGVRLDEEDCYVKVLESSKGKLVFQQFNSILKRWEDKNKIFEIDNLGLKIGTLKSLSKQESKQFENDDDDSEGKVAVLNSLRYNSSNNNTFWEQKSRNLPSNHKKYKVVSDSATPTPKSSVSASLTPTPTSYTSKSLKSQNTRKSNTQPKSKKTKKSKADRMVKKEIANKRANNVAANKFASNTNIKTTALIETKNLIKSFGISRNPSSNTDTTLNNYIISEFEQNNNFQEIESSSMSQIDLNKVKKALNTLFLNLEDEQYSDVQKQIDKINGLVKSSQITIIKPSKSSSEERLRLRQSENNRVRDIERWAREANSLKNLLAKPKGKVKSVSARNSVANQIISTAKRSKKKKSASSKPKLRLTMKLKDNWITQNQGSHQNNKPVNSILERIPKLPNASFLNFKQMTPKQKDAELERFQKYYTKQNASFLEEKPPSAKELNSVLSTYGGIRYARAQFTNNNDSRSSNSNSELLAGSKQKRKSSYKKKKTKKGKQ